MGQPFGFEQYGSSPFVCKLHKALYELKQAPQAWFESLSQFLDSLEFITSRVDSSLLIKQRKIDCCYILVYVDDKVMTGSFFVVISDLIAILN